MTTQAERAMSFGSIADEYNRLRPSPPRSAVEWLLPPGCQVAVDLAAGTGLLSRALASQVAQVVAVEPDVRMGAVLRAHSPGVRVVAGKGEAIPMRDAMADGLFVSSAWHWMNPELAVPEVARVVRDRGRFGVIWTSRDRQVEWVQRIDRLREPGGSGGQPGGSGGQPEPARGIAVPDRPRREVSLPQPGLFGDVETASFTFSRVMAASDFVAMIATYSRIIVATDEVRAATLERVRAAVDDQFAGASEIEVPMRSLCWRASRTAR